MLPFSGRILGLKISWSNGETEEREGTQVRHYFPALADRVAVITEKCVGHVMR
jgi:hypothetical protein